MSSEEFLSQMTGASSEDLNGQHSPHECSSPFTNKVISIRPKLFYGNEEAQADNKFMSTRSHSKEETNEIVPQKSTNIY